MAFKELWRSQQIVVDEDGSRFHRVFLCDLADWLSGAFYYRVGQSLSFDGWFPQTQWTDALLINEINARPTENQSILHIDVYYSTKTTNRGYERPDQARSWECSGGVSSTEKDLTSYLRWVPGEKPTYTTLDEQWMLTDKYHDSIEGQEGDDIVGEPAPAIPVAGDYHEMTFTLYGSTLNMFRLSSAVGMVNADRFATDVLNWFGLNTDCETDAAKLPLISDYEKWRFVDLRYSRVRLDCWRYDMTFRQHPAPVILLHNDWPLYTWNQPFGDSITYEEGGAPWRVGAYPSIKFLELFEGMDKVEPEQLQGGGSQ